jgi:hypothetical protein
VQTTAASTGNAALYAWNAGTGQSPYLVFRRSKGGTIGSHVAVGLNDNLGMIVFQGSGGSLFQVGVTIQALAAAAPVGGPIPASLVFQTVNLSGISGERMRLWPSGGLMLDPSIGNNDPGFGGVRARRYGAHQATDAVGVDGYGCGNTANSSASYWFQGTDNHMKLYCTTGIDVLNRTVGSLSNTAGYVGEVLEISVPLASRVTLDSGGGYTNITSYAFPAGTWDITAFGQFVLNYAGSAAMNLGISLVSGSVGDDTMKAAGVTTGPLIAISTTQRFVLTSTTTVYMTGSSYTTPNPASQGYGRLRGIRVLG